MILQVERKRVRQAGPQQLVQRQARQRDNGFFLFDGFGRLVQFLFAFRPAGLDARALIGCGVSEAQGAWIAKIPASAPGCRHHGAGLRRGCDRRHDGAAFPRPRSMADLAAGGRGGRRGPCCAGTFHRPGPAAAPRSRSPGSYETGVDSEGRSLDSSCTCGSPGAAPTRWWSVWAMASGLNPDQQPAGT